MLGPHPNLTQFTKFTPYYHELQCRDMLCALGKIPVENLHMFPPTTNINAFLPFRQDVRLPTEVSPSRLNHRPHRFFRSRSNRGKTVEVVG